MEEFLTTSFKHLLPYYILALVVSELLLFLKEKKGLGFEVIVASILCILLTVLAQFQTHSSWALENRPALLAFVNLLSILMPIATFTIANQFVTRIEPTPMKHMALLGTVLVTMFIWPLWALFVTCASGLDCI
jgi:hypothetical protein